MKEETWEALVEYHKKVYPTTVYGRLDLAVVKERVDKAIKAGNSTDFLSIINDLERELVYLREAAAFAGILLQPWSRGADYDEDDCQVDNGEALAVIERFLRGDNALLAYRESMKGRSG